MTAIRDLITSAERSAIEERYEQLRDLSALMREVPVPPDPAGDGHDDDPTTEGESSP